jgi:hypothetical protein
MLWTRKQIKGELSFADVNEAVLARHLTAEASLTLKKVKVRQIDSQLQLSDHK